MRWLVLAALVACQASSPPPVQNCPAPSTHTCKAVIEKAGALVNLRERKLTLAVGECEQTGWSDAVLSCVDGAATPDVLVACGAQYGVKGDLFKPVPNGAAVMKQIAEFKDQICACKDSACVQHVSDEMTKWGQAMAKTEAESPHMSDEDSKRTAQIAEEMSKCMMKTMGTTP